MKTKMSERTYNAITKTTAKKMAQTLRRAGYQVRRKQQWIYVEAKSLDMEVGRIARRYGAIAY